MGGKGGGHLEGPHGGEDVVGLDEDGSEGQHAAHQADGPRPQVPLQPQPQLSNPVTEPRLLPQICLPYSNWVSGTEACHSRRGIVSHRSVELPWPL